MEKNWLEWHVMLHLVCFYFIYIGLFIPVDPLVLVGGHCTRWRSCWNPWLPYWLRRLWWSGLLLSKQLLVQAVYLLQFNLGLCVHVLILIRAHSCVWKLGSVPGWFTSFPFVSPFSNHSTDTILLFVSTPLTAAPWIRPEVCRKKTKLRRFEEKRRSYIANFQILLTVAPLYIDGEAYSENAGVHSLSLVLP